MKTMIADLLPTTTDNYSVLVGKCWSPNHSCRSLPWQSRCPSRREDGNRLFQTEMSLLPDDVPPNYERFFLCFVAEMVVGKISQQ